MSRGAKILGLSVLGLLVGAWGFGLLAFVAEVGAYRAPGPMDMLAPAEAIVVLTGGSARIETGVELLKAGKGRKLFVSGVYPGVGADKVLQGANVPSDLLACCVVLGHAAGSTFGNAEETRAFMAGEGYRSLRLVTAHYHMPRSLRVLGAAMPEVQIFPHPVQPERVDLDGWWWHWGTAKLLIGEYHKFVGASLHGLWGGGA